MRQATGEVPGQACAIARRPPARCSGSDTGDGHASNGSPAPGGGSGGWPPPHWGPSRFNGGPYGGAGVPNYYIWVPGSAIFDDPFPDWRGPTGGWGNP